VLQYFAAWCSVVQCVAACCSALQYVPVCRLQVPNGVATFHMLPAVSGLFSRRALFLPDSLSMSVNQCVAACFTVLQCVAVRCSALQYVSVCCSVLQCVAVCRDCEVSCEK